MRAFGARVYASAASSDCSRTSRRRRRADRSSWRCVGASIASIGIRSSPWLRRLSCPPRGFSRAARALFHSSAAHTARKPKRARAPPAGAAAKPARCSAPAPNGLTNGTGAAPHVSRAAAWLPSGSASLQGRRRARVKPHARSATRGYAGVCAQRPRGCASSACAASSRTSRRRRRGQRSFWRCLGEAFASISARVLPQQHPLSCPPRGSCRAARGFCCRFAVHAVRKRKRDSMPPAPLGAPQRPPTALASLRAQRQRRAALRTVSGRHQVPHRRPRAHRQAGQARGRTVGRTRRARWRVRQRCRHNRRR
jgi:hypothetical protein